MSEKNKSAVASMKNDFFMSLANDYSGEDDKHPSLTIPNQTPNTHKIDIKEVKRVLNEEEKALAPLYEQYKNLEQIKRELASRGYQDYINHINYKNAIIGAHNKSLQFIQSKGVNFWKSSAGTTLYYSVNSYGKRKKVNNKEELFPILGMHVEIYDNIEDIKYLSHDKLILISSYLAIIEDEKFLPNIYDEFVNMNNFMYRNTFQHTSYLQYWYFEEIRRSLTSNMMGYPVSLPWINHTELINPISSVFNVSVLPNLGFDYDDRSHQLNTTVVYDFIWKVSQNRTHNAFIFFWIICYFKFLQKSGLILVLIGSDKTTDILVNHIIKPIFAAKIEYFSTIDNGTLKKSNELLLKDKIFYHFNNISPTKGNNNKVKDLLVEILQLSDENNAELIVTSSTENPYAFLKDYYNRCVVFKVKDIDTVLKNMNIDFISLVDNIKNDLDNFSKYMVDTDEYNVSVLDTPEKGVLSSMKNGILRTHNFNQKVNSFIRAIQEKDLSFFQNIQNENEEMHKELEDNFKEDMIAQPLLYEYFNIVFEDKFILENNHLLEILKENAPMFQVAPDDSSKSNGKKRYQIPTQKSFE